MKMNCTPRRFCPLAGYIFCRRTGTYCYGIWFFVRIAPGSIRLPGPSGFPEGKKPRREALRRPPVPSGARTLQTAACAQDRCRVRAVRPSCAAFPLCTVPGVCRQVFLYMQKPPDDCFAQSDLTGNIPVEQPVHYIAYTIQTPFIINGVLPNCSVYSGPTQPVQNEMTGIWIKFFFPPQQPPWTGAKRYTGRFLTSARTERPSQRFAADIHSACRWKILSFRLVEAKQKGDTVFFCVCRMNKNRPAVPFMYSCGACPGLFKQIQCQTNRPSSVTYNVRSIL